MVVNMNMHGNKEGDINQYLAADREARGKAEELIRMEELLACELKPFL